MTMAGPAISDCSPPPLRIGLFGLFGCGNFGNDGSLEAMIRHLRTAHPQADLVTICVGPKTVTLRYGVCAIPIISEPVSAPRSAFAKLGVTLPVKIANFFRALRETRKLDVLIMPGTGLLDDFTSGVLGIPLDLFLWCLAARITGTKIMMVSVGAGPIVHPLSRWLMTSAAALATFRSYRDQASKTYLARLNVDTTHDPIYPDIAFSLPSPAPNPHDRNNGKLSVGIGVMTYRGWHTNRPDSDSTYQAYLKELTGFAKWLLEGGHSLRLLTGDEIDHETVQAFYSRLKGNVGADAARDVAIEDAATLHDVMKAMARTDIVVATRFHNIICALKAGRPVLSIGYAEKNRSLLNLFGLGDSCVGIDTFKTADIIDRFEAIVAERASHERRIAATLKDLECRLQEQYNLIDRKLLDRGLYQTSREHVLAVIRRGR